MSIRKFEKSDRENILHHIKATNVFNDEEVEIAKELIDVFLDEPNQKDYDLYVYADEENIAQGYICIGHTPATIGTYDLYWIVVNPNEHKKGIGKALLYYIEEMLKLVGGNLLIAETSSTQKYDNTRKFYERTNFIELVRIKEYYRPDDDLIIFGKYLK